MTSSWAISRSEHPRMRCTRTAWARNSGGNLRPFGTMTPFLNTRSCPISGCQRKRVESNSKRQVAPAGEPAFIQPTATKPHT